MSVESYTQIKKHLRTLRVYINFKIQSILLMKCGFKTVFLF